MGRPNALHRRTRGGRRRGWSQTTRSRAADNKRLIQQALGRRTLRRRDDDRTRATGKKQRRENNKSVSTTISTIQPGDSIQQRLSQARGRSSHSALSRYRRRGRHNRDRTRHDDRTPKRLGQTRQVGRRRARARVSADMRRKPGLLHQRLRRRLALQPRRSFGAHSLFRVAALLGQLPLCDIAPRRGRVPGGRVFLCAREQVCRVGVTRRVGGQTLGRRRTRRMRARRVDAGCGRRERGCGGGRGSGRD